MAISQSILPQSAQRVKMRVASDFGYLLYLKRRNNMSAVKPLPAEKAPAELKPVLEAMKAKFGKMPAFFGTMAHKPEVLKNFLPLYAAITGPGAVEQKLKEFAYLK